MDKFEGDLKLNDNLNEAFQHWVSKMNMKNVTFLVTNAVNEGDNYVSEIHRIVVEYLDKEEGQKTISLIVKSLPDDVASDAAYINGTFCREIFVYEELFTAMEDVQNEHHVEADEKLKTVKCYAASTEKSKEYIILEDLKPLNFQLADKFKSLNLDQVRLVVRDLAKLHALSFALKHRDPDAFMKLVDKVAAKGFAEDLKSYVRFAVDKAEQVMDDEECKRKIREFGRDVVGRNVKLGEHVTDDPYHVLCHADCWVNNMMFRYENGKAVEVRLLDYQVMRFWSPVRDLSHFIFLTTDEDLRAEHYSEIFRYYYEQLQRHLDRLGLAAEAVYPGHVYEEQQRTCMEGGLMAAIGGLAFILSKPGETPNLKDVYGDDIDVTRVKYSDEVVKRLRGVVSDFVKMKLI